MKIIDNFLEIGDFELLKDEIIHTSNFPWYYSTVLVNGSESCEKIYNYQFFHMLYENNVSNSQYYFPLMNPFLTKLNINSLVRVKINFNPSTHKIIEHGMHTDVSFKCLTAVFYLNTNNGYTKLETGEKIDSLENRIVIFDSSKKHTGTTCTDQIGRYVININFFSESLII